MNITDAVTIAQYAIAAICVVPAAIFCLAALDKAPNHHPGVAELHSWQFCLRFAVGFGAVAALLIFA